MQIPCSNSLSITKVHYLEVVLLLTLRDCMPRVNRCYRETIVGSATVLRLSQRPSAKSSWAGRAERVLLTGSTRARAHVLTKTRAGPSVVRSESASSGCKPVNVLGLYPPGLGRGPPLPRLAGATARREKARTRATKRENSITLAPPAGDEADSPDQVLASTLLGAKGGGA